MIRIIFACTSCIYVIQATFVERPYPWWVLVLALSLVLLSMGSVPLFLVLHWHGATNAGDGQSQYGRLFGSFYSSQATVLSRRVNKAPEIQSEASLQMGRMQGQEGAQPCEGDARKQSDKGQRKEVNTGQGSHVLLKPTRKVNIKDSDESLITSSITSTSQRLESQVQMPFVEKNVDRTRHRPTNLEEH